MQAKSLSGSTRFDRAERRTRLHMAHPMKLSDRLTRMIDGMPDGASITLPVEVVKGWLTENGSGLDHDLTVEEVAKFFGRTPATIRAWIRAGRLEAYLFRGNEYRITHTALEGFQDQERNGISTEHSNSAHDRG